MATEIGANSRSTDVNDGNRDLRPSHSPLRGLPRSEEAQGTLAGEAVSAMTRHDFEAWLDHHLEQPVLVEWRTLSSGEVTDTSATTGVLR